VESEEGFGSQFTLSLPRGHDHLQPDEKMDERLPPDAVSDLFQSARAPTVGRGRDAAERSATTDGAPLDPEDAAGVGTEDITTLLLVEDNAEVRAYIRTHLAKDYRLIEATNGEEGLERARTHLPDLVLSDVMMPKMDGIELCRALRTKAETDFIPVILLTARAETEDRIGGLQEGADDYLTKPFDIDELRARIENLIRSRQRLRERFSDVSISMQPEAPEASSVDRVFIDAARSTIEAHMGEEDFTVDQFAEAMGISRVHLYRRLQDLLGESPSTLIRSVRLERAAQLLAQQAGSVSEVAYGVGFKSVSHFSRAFREQHGHVPSEHPVQAASD
jgi:DNA-binding response OmpR family regulator